MPKRVDPEGPIDAEIWKDVKGFPYYEISNYGRVKSKKQSLPKILRSGISRSGYSSVTLFKQGRRFYFSVHRLVLEDFVGLCPLGYESNHKNGIKTDNRLENLEWVTHSENQAHAYKKGLISRVGESAPFGGAKLKKENVLEIRKLAEKGVYQRIIAERFGITRGHVSALVKRRYWSHI